MKKCLNEVHLIIFSSSPALLAKDLKYYSFCNFFAFFRYSFYSSVFMSFHFLLFISFSFPNNNINSKSVFFLLYRVSFHSHSFFFLKKKHQIWLALMVFNQVFFFILLHCRHRLIVWCEPSFGGGGTLNKFVLDSSWRQGTEEDIPVFVFILFGFL